MYKKWSNKFLLINVCIKVADNTVAEKCQNAKKNKNANKKLKMRKKTKNSEKKIKKMRKKNWKCKQKTKNAKSYN